MCSIQSENGSEEQQDQKHCGCNVGSGCLAPDFVDGYTVIAVSKS